MGEMQRALEVLRQLDAAVASLASLQPSELDPLQLVDGISRLIDAETRLKGVQATWLSAADTTDAIVDATGRSARSWLIEGLHLGGGDASRRMRLARGLTERPALREAVAGAQITTDQADAVLHVLKELPGAHHDAVEEARLDVARAGTLADVNAAVDEVAARLGAETAEERAARRYAERGVQLDQTFGGTGSLSGTLSNECRETLRLALHAAAGPPQVAGVDDPRTATQRRHDALQDIAAFFLAPHRLGSAGGGRTAAGRGHRGLRAAAGADRGLGRRAGFTPARGGLRLRCACFGATVRRMACDAQIIPAVLGGTSEVLDLGRGSRPFNLAIRRAAKLRDGGRCARHGCRRRVVDCHHIVWWSLGGPSSLDNAVWLCAFHHWLVHEGGWSLRRLGPGRYVFTDPNGRDHGPPPIGSDPPQRTVA